MAKLIGTAGHVDHGKTSLIAALTGIDADRLPEEKRRGMTIEVGVAYMDVPGHGRVSIVDVPGHERLVSNMLIGAWAMDLALLCVAADDGVKPQTREHTEILDLLPVQRMVVALTRADLASADQREAASAQVRDLLAGTRFAGAAIVPVSATTGEGLRELEARIAEALGVPEPVMGRDWYLPIDRVFAAPGRGAVVAGTLGGGEVRVGDEVEIVPGGLRARVRAIQCHGEEREGSERGVRTALNLAGVSPGDVRRGSAAAKPGVAFGSRVADATVRWRAEARHGMRVRVAIGSDEAAGRVFLSDHDSTLAQVRLDRDMAIAAGQPVLLRHPTLPHALGGGLILTPVASARRKSEQPARGEDLLGTLERAENGATADDLARTLGRPVADVERALDSADGPLKVGDRWFARPVWERSAARFVDALRQCHDAAPAAGWHPREDVLRMAGLHWQGRLLDRALQRLAADAAIELDGTSVRLAGFQVRLNARQRALLDRLKEVLDREPLACPSSAEVARELTVPVQAIDEIERVGIEARELVRLADGVVLTSQALKRLASDLRQAVAGSPFTPSHVRDALGGSRRTVIPLLEHFDAIGLTRRQGDARTIRAE